MRYGTLVLVFLIIWADAASAQNPISPVAILFNSNLLLLSLAGEMSLERRATISPIASGSIAAFLQHNFRTHAILTIRQTVFPLASSNSSLKYRLSSDSVEVKYLFTRGLALRVSVGEQHAPIKMWNGYMRASSPSGPLHQAQATAGIGLSF